MVFSRRQRSSDLTLLIHDLRCSMLIPLPAETEAGRGRKLELELERRT